MVGEYKCIVTLENGDTISPVVYGGRVHIAAGGGGVSSHGVPLSGTSDKSAPPTVLTPPPHSHSF